MSAVTKLGKASTAVRKPKIKRAGISLRLKRDPTQARGIAIATQSTAASAAGIQATFICGGFFGFAYTKERNWAYFACGAKLPERKLKRGRAILYHVWRVLTWLDLTWSIAKTKTQNFPLSQCLNDPRSDVGEFFRLESLLGVEIYTSHPDQTRCASLISHVHYSSRRAATTRNLN